MTPHSIGSDGGPEDGDRQEKAARGRFSEPLGFGRPESGRPGRAAAVRGDVRLAEPGATLGAAFQQLGQMLSYEGGPVNWDMAKDIARQTVAQGTADGARTPAWAAPSARRSRRPCGSPTCGWTASPRCPSGSGAAVAWSRAEWVEATLPVWQELVDPVAERVGAGHGRRAARRRCRPMAGPADRHDAVHGRRDVRRPDRAGRRRAGRRGRRLAPTSGCRSARPARPRCCRPNIAAFGEGLGVPAGRGAALPGAARGRPPAAVRARAVAAGAPVRRGRGLRARHQGRHRPAGGGRRRSSTRTQPEQLQEALQQGMFQPEDTPEQKAALARLETALALVEGWVDAVVHAAAEPHLPSARTRCARRCAAAAPPAARPSRPSPPWSAWSCGPRRLRDAAALWAPSTDAAASTAATRLGPPGHAADADDLDDPDGFVHRRADADRGPLGSTRPSSAAAGDQPGRTTGRPGRVSPTARPPDLRAGARCSLRARHRHRRQAAAHRQYVDHLEPHRTGCGVTGLRRT